MKLLEKYPEVLRFWDWERNNVDPRVEKVLTQTRYWWKCIDCNSSYDQKLCKKIEGVGCPYCAGKRVNEANSLVVRYPSILKVWSDKNTVDINTLICGSHKACIFICELCNKECIIRVNDWEKQFNQRNNLPRKLCGNHNFYIDGCEIKTRKVTRKVLHNSLANNFPHLEIEWSVVKNTTDFHNLNAGSDYMAWWNCLDCGSEYQQLVWGKVQGYKCPYCTGRKVNHTNNLLKTDPGIVNEWDYEKNNSIPENYSRGSHTRIWWKCGNGHSWDAVIKARCLLNQDCPTCMSGKEVTKPEIEWLDYLGVPQEYRQARIKIGKQRFKPDALDPNTKTIYEMNGDFWHGNPEKYNRNDTNPKTGETFGYLYDKTIERKNILTNAGYTVISIWLSEWEKLLKIGNNKIYK